jgi:hypothetical protein
LRIGGAVETRELLGSDTAYFEEYGLSLAASLWAPSSPRGSHMQPQGFPKTFIIGRYHGIRAAICPNCCAVFWLSADAYIHYEARTCIKITLEKKNQ